MTRISSDGDSSKTPFFDGLKRYVDRSVVRFHTPGHRGGRWLYPQWHDVAGSGAFSLDVSDVLEGPRGPLDWSAALNAAQNQAEKLFGSGATRFLVNGTSGGVHAGIYGLALGGDVLFSRASHLSVYAGVMLGRCEPHYIAPRYDARWDIAGPPALTSVIDQVRRHRPALIVDTYPNYYGLAHDLKELIRQVDPVRVLADEAHGSHFAVCPDAPPQALSCGCAVTVQSAHKTLGALTQASMLHVHRDALSLVPLLDRALSLFQTTSASPLLLASLEAVVAEANESDGSKWAGAVHLTEELRKEIDSQTCFSCLSGQEATARWGARLDPTRLVVNVADSGWTGLAAAHWLRGQHNIQVELANQRAVVVLISPGNSESDAESLVEALTALSQLDAAAALKVVPPPGIPAQRALPWEALQRPTRWVAPRESAGRIAGELICPYPPGIPVVVPGEEITSEIVEYLEHVYQAGWEVRGPAYPDLSLVAVLK